MTTPTRTRPDSWSGTGRPPRRARARLAADAVVATYVRDISTHQRLRLEAAGGR
jgi:hypothetical protein